MREKPSTKELESHVQHIAVNQLKFDAHQLYAITPQSIEIGESACKNPTLKVMVLVDFIDGRVPRHGKLQCWHYSNHGNGINHVGGNGVINWRNDEISARDLSNLNKILNQVEPDDAKRIRLHLGLNRELIRKIMA